MVKEAINGEEEKSPLKPFSQYEDEKKAAAEKARADVLNVPKGQEAYIEAIKKHKVDPIAFGAWLIAKIFEKNKDKPWYKGGLTPEKAIAYVATGKLPLSLYNLIDYYKNFKALQKKFGKISEEDLDLLQAGIDKQRRGEDVEFEPTGEEPEPEPEVKEKEKYLRGGERLKNVAQDLGGLSQMQVVNITKNAEEKLRKLTNGAELYDLSPQQADELEEKIDIAVEDESMDYAAKLKATNNVDAFLETLVKDHILNSNERELVTQEEKDGLQILLDKDEETIAAILETDFEDEDSLFKTFQNAVSHNLFPAAKRGPKPKGIVPTENE